MANTRAILFTITTYGIWLRGDARGWVDDGIVFPAQPSLEAWDRLHLKHSPYLFPRDRWFDIGQAIGESLIERLNLRIWAMTIQGWHGHLLAGSTRHHVAEVVKCAKDAVRWHLRVDRPIWAVDYDKRFCFDWNIMKTRARYVEKHNLQNGWEPKPWRFIKTPSEIC